MQVKKKTKKPEDLVKLVKFQTCTEISDVEYCKEESKHF